VASGALDTNAIVWSPGSKTNYTVVKGISYTCMFTCYIIDVLCACISVLMTDDSLTFVC